ncbi:MAG: YbbR-like domain-containing protein [Fidelibacterota bacterium]
MKLPGIKQFWKEGHLKLWVGAFFFALLLWLLVVSEREYVHTLDVPIEIRNIPARKTLSAEIVPTAEVRFHGTGRALFQAILLKSLSNLKLVLDLDRIKTEYDFDLNNYYKDHPEKVVIPEGFDIKYISVVQPDSVHIALDDNAERAVPVRINISIQPAPGFVQVGGLTYSPRSIELKGPKTEVMPVRMISTKRQEFKGLSTDLNVMVDLDFNFPQTVEVSPSTVTVRADIQSIGERILTEIPVQLLNEPAELKVYPNPSVVSLTVKGGVDYIAQVDPKDINVTIDFLQWQRDQSYYEPKVEVPTDILGFSDLSPKNIELVVTRVRE